MNHPTGTPAKLNNGSWGARTTEPVAPGQTITVTTRTGKSWDATVNEVLWNDHSVWLVSTRKHNTPSKPKTCLGSLNNPNVSDYDDYDDYDGYANSISNQPETVA